MNNKKIILKQIKKHNGELVLDLFEVVKLEGFYEDEEDYYYIYRNLIGEKIYSSCVGSFIPLKSQLNRKYYNELLRIFNLNLPKKENK